MDPNQEVEQEYPPFFIRYKSGRIERLRGTETVPASLDPTTGVTSKDVQIHPPNVSARLYLPNLSNSATKNNLPILVYYHGGGFVIESASSPTYHNYLNILAAKACVLVVSVEYRCAPEHPLPAAYDDSWAALQWVKSSADDWIIQHGDLQRVFLAGDSAGANIAHHMAMKAGEGGAELGIKIVGAALVHPYFWGKDAVGLETRDPASRGFVEKLWKTASPETEGMDDKMINPLSKAAPSLAGMGCSRVVVFVAEKDLLRERGRLYCEGLLGSGWGGEAELVEDEGEDHVFHLFNPTGEKALAMMERMVAFLNQA